MDVQGGLNSKTIGATSPCQVQVRGMEELETLVPILNPEMRVRLVSLISENRRLLEEKATSEREARDLEKENKGLGEALEKINQLQGLLEDKKMEVKFLREKLTKAVEGFGDVGLEAFDNFKRKRKDLDGNLASVELRRRNDEGVTARDNDPTSRQRSTEQDEGTSATGSRRVGVNQVNTSDDGSSVPDAANNIVAVHEPPVLRTDEATSQPGGPPSQPENQVPIAGLSASGRTNGLDKTVEKLESETGSVKEEPKDYNANNNNNNNPKGEGKRYSLKRKPRDTALPSPPKRPRNAFKQFQMEQLNAMKDTRLGKGEKLKAIGQEWRNLDGTAKEPYQMRAQMSESRFKRQKKAFKKKCEENNLTVYTPNNPARIMKKRK